MTKPGRCLGAVINVEKSWSTIRKPDQLLMKAGINDEAGQSGGVRFIVLFCQLSHLVPQERDALIGST